MKKTDSLFPSRRLEWVSSMDKRNADVLASLENRMREYYLRNQYYEDIVSGTTLWNKPAEAPLHQDIIERVSNKKVLEIGCGTAQILTTGKIRESDFSGCDFSTDLMARNKKSFPAAEFRTLKDGGRLPYEDATFDAVFSVFVIEHTVYPARFLEESVRVLRPGGTWILLCPDFLGKSRMSSQRVGYSLGSGAEKLRKGRFVDAILTGIDQRIRIPLACARLRKAAANGPKFYVNLAPVCFDERKFRPDVDAVYLTYNHEIQTYLRDRLQFLPLGKEMAQIADSRRLIYTVGERWKSF